MLTFHKELVMNKQILYFDMDNVLVDFKSGIDKLSQDDLIIYKGRYDDVPGIFSLMEPMDGAIDAFDALSVKYDVYILSTAPWENPSAWSCKIKWVKKHLGDRAYKRLILSHNKNLNKGDYLIDDRTANGAGDFDGELIQFGSGLFPDWNSIKDYLLCRGTE
jgi:5'(3')-deoxyribonucleotidase